ncbi:hypothetical protein [Streptomyces sp. NPDC001315]|uniref:hypothetical protein n=1 Tax=Streptomyces sp. NPDC001315 TaxID=3364562 RepID=UPI00368BDE72
MDNTRTTAAKEYQKAHPQQKMRIVTIPPDAGYVPTKISLANHAEQGCPMWPPSTGGPRADPRTAPPHQLTSQ